LLKGVKTKEGAMGREEEGDLVAKRGIEEALGTLQA